MTFHDLREFLGELDKHDELQRIEIPVDKDWEVGAICREAFDRQGPALLFTRVGEFHTPLATGVIGTRGRYALALGVQPTAPAIIERWRQAYAHPIKPVVAKDAPCKEIRMEKIDLFKDPFTAPIWHKGDGGPYLGTFHIVIAKDPETGWTNCGTYRNQVLEKDVLGILLVDHRHGGMIWEKWRRRGQPMPIALAIGLEPYLIMVGVSNVPLQMDEYDIAGGLKGGPIELVRAETCDLLVPSTAEIIIEGEVPTDEFYPGPEGPFGESPGYMGQVMQHSKFIRVKAVTHRRNPISQGTLEGRPPNESTESIMYGRCIALLEHLRRAEIPGVVDACLTVASHAAYHAIVSIKKSYKGHVRDVMANVWGQPNQIIKHVIVVDDDIDPWDPFQVEWAVATRVQASRDVVIITGGKSYVLDPSQVPSRRGWSDWMGIDATKPVDEYRWDGGEFPPSADPPREWRERVRERWQAYGFQR